MAKISIISAVSNNNVIGLNNKLLWKQSEDLQRFKSLTLNKTVIMGRNTLLSLPNGALKNRNNIVLTDNLAADANDSRFNNTALFSSICELLKNVCKGDDEIFVIGGGMIYKQFLPYTNKLYLTKIDVDIQGDVYFPEVDYNKWNETYSQSYEKDERNEYNYTFKIYEK